MFALGHKIQVNLMVLLHRIQPVRMGGKLGTHLTESDADENRPKRIKVTLKHPFIIEVIYWLTTPPPQKKEHV